VTEVAAEVSGLLVEIFVDLGDTVDARAPLFRIDPGPYEMALAEARAGLALARAESENASQEAERMQSLFEENAVSRQRYDQVRTQAAVARARVTQMEARVARAERDLERTLVRAPYTGSIVDRRAHEGSMAGGAPIVVIQESGALEAILNVPEATPIPVRVGDPVQIFVEALDHPLETRIERVSDRIDPQTRTYEVRCPVVDPSRAVKAGAYVRAEVLPSREIARPVVDRSSVVSRDGRNLVMRIAQGIVEPVPVRIGLSADERVEILAGVEVGDVVVRGEAARRMSKGQRVDPVLVLAAPPSEPRTAAAAPVPEIP
jgi:RND family efflux transporter MFP subunit